MSKVIVVGGGAAGMMAAIAAARGGHRVTILEKNEKLGKKIYITGKGRGNLTNSCEVSEFFDSVVKNPKFLYSAIYGFTPQDMIDFMEASGVPVKVERGNRVFPASDHASDITKALERELRSLRVSIRLYTGVKSLLVEESAGGSDDGTGRKINGVITNEGERILADAVILATGGLSYQTTGSNGDGHRMLKALGLNVTDCYPSLVALTTSEKDCHGLSGLSLKNVGLTVKSGKKVLYDGFGEMLFTHNGISGPLGLSASANITDKLNGDKTFELLLDIKPALDNDKLYDRICRDIDASPKRELSFLLSGLLPKSLAVVVAERLSIDKKKHLCDISKQERLAIVDMLKSFRLTVTGTGGFKEAIITRGGLEVKEIDPSTMRVKSIDGLYVAGELIDVDALTGGYNLQIAFSTGYLAGTNVSS